MTSTGIDDERLDGSTHVVVVTGELDMRNVRDLRRRILAAMGDGCLRIVVDLGGVTHMDSSGLAALIEARQRAVELHGGVALVVGTPHIARTLEIRGVRDLFILAGSRGEALAALGQA
jgi:anti-sigma B factor antagonist